MEQFIPYHTHFIATMTISKPPLNKEIIGDWLTRLVSAVKMQILGGPYVFHCEDIGNEGITGIVVLSTSHCSVHFWDKVEIPYVQVDLYSCMEFSTSIIMDMIDEFGIVEVVHQYHIDRNLPHNSMLHGSLN